MARPSRYATKRTDQQFECECLSEEYYDQCMCGANGDHYELDRLRDEEPQHFFDTYIG